MEDGATADPGTGQRDDELLPYIGRMFALKRSKK
jgi:hypothetical protein